MHNCTRVWGKTLSMASGKPVSPSTHAMKISLTPRFCSSVSTASQNLAPSFCESHIPSSSLFPLSVTPSAKYTALLLTRWFSLTLTRQAVQVDNRVDRLQRPGLPLAHLLHERLSHVGNQGWRHLHTVEFLQLRLD